MPLTSNVAAFARGASSNTTDEMTRMATMCGARPKSCAAPVGPSPSAKRNKGITASHGGGRLTSNTVGFLEQQGVDPTPTTSALPVAPPPSSLPMPETPRRTTNTTPAVGGTNRAWWISQSPNLPMDRRNGWVVTMAMEEFTKEAEFAEACDKAVFATRMREAGLAELVDGRGGPRRKCQALR